MEDTGHDISGHEHSDVSVRGIVISTAGLAIALAVVCLLVFGMFLYLNGHQPAVARSNPMAEESPQQIPPAPRIEEHPAIEIRELHAKEDTILSTYGWTDKKHGIVRVPIERAMELQLERGFPTAGGSKR